MTEKMADIPVRGTADRVLVAFGHAMTGFAAAVWVPFVVALYVVPLAFVARSLRPVGGPQWVAALAATALLTWAVVSIVGPCNHRVYRWAREGMPPRKEFEIPRLRAGRGVVVLLAYGATYPCVYAMWLAVYWALSKLTTLVHRVLWG